MHPSVRQHEGLPVASQHERCQPRPTPGAAQDAAAEAAKIKATLEEYVQLLQEIFQYYAGAAEVGESPIVLVPRVPRGPRLPLVQDLG